VSAVARLAAAVAVVAVGAAVAAAAPPPTPGVSVVRQSVVVRATSMVDGEWVPSIALLLRGELPDGAEVVAEYTRPDGKLWGAVTLRPGRADGRGVRAVSPTMLEPEAPIREGGTIGVTVQLRAAGASRPLFTGRVRVDALPPAPSSSNKPAFSVDHDWVLPLVQLFFDPQREDNPALLVTAWWKGHSVDCHDVDAALVYGGKVIATTADPAQGDKSVAETLRSTDDRDARRYVQCRFELAAVKGWVNGQYQDQASWHELPKRPGEYEVRLSRGGAVERTVRFTVDKNGMLARAGAVELAYRGARMLVGAVGAEAFYGNPELARSAEEPLATLYESWEKRPGRKPSAR